MSKSNVEFEISLDILGVVTNDDMTKGSKESGGKKGPGLIYLYLAPNVFTRNRIDRCRQTSKS